MRARLFVLTIGCLLAACGTEPAPPPPPFAGKIVFASDRATLDGAPVLYSMNPDGSNIRRIPIPLPASFADPDVSPDGHRLVFTRDGIYTVRADGSDLRHLTIDGSPLRAKWSPDGQWLAFISGRSGNLDIWVMDQAGGQLRNVTNSPDADEFLGDWSPDNARLVYDRRPRDASTLDQVWTIRTDGTDATQVTEDTTEALWPSYSPDGLQIAYMLGQLGHLHIMASDGSGDHSIFNADSVNIFDPTWSPDGQSIAMSFGPGIATIRPDGTGLTVIVDSAYNREPVWGPAVK